MEKTFEELIDDKAYFNRWLKELTESETELIKELMQQVREATNEEWCQAFLGVTLPAEAVNKIGAIITKPNSIKTDL